MRRVLPAVLPAALTAALVAVVLAGTVLTGNAEVAARAGGHTARVVVRPVDATGHAVDGWTVKRQRGYSVQCTGPARAAVDAGIVECAPAAAYLPACWKSAHHTVLCVRDPREHTLVRVHYTGRLHRRPAPAQPSPIALRLPHHQSCSIRVGGAWGQVPGHPRWVGFYSCDRGSVYGPPNGDGVDRSHPRWTVHLWRSGTDHTVVTRPVRKAWFVGTAA